MYVILRQSIKIHEIFDTNWFQLISQKTRTDGEREIAHWKHLSAFSGFLQRLQASFEASTVILGEMNFEFIKILHAFDEATFMFVGSMS